MIEKIKLFLIRIFKRTKKSPKPKRECPKCHGHGKTYDYTSTGKSGYYKYQTCRKCKGKGEI